MLFLLQSLNLEHVVCGLARGQVEAAWKGCGDGLAVGGGSVVHQVSVYFEKFLRTSLSNLS